MRSKNKQPPQRVETRFRNDPYQERRDTEVSNNRNNPSSNSRINQGLSQSELVEEFNRRRNLGISDVQNPVFDENLSKDEPKPTVHTAAPPNDGTFLFLLPIDPETY